MIIATTENVTVRVIVRVEDLEALLEAAKSRQKEIAEVQSIDYSIGSAKVCNGWTNELLGYASIYLEPLSPTNRSTPLEVA